MPLGNVRAASMAALATARSCGDEDSAVVLAKCSPSARPLGSSSSGFFLSLIAHRRANSTARKTETTMERRAANKGGAQEGAKEHKEEGERVRIDGARGRGEEGDGFEGGRTKKRRTRGTPPHKRGERAGEGMALKRRRRGKRRERLHSPSQLPLLAHWPATSSEMRLSPRCSTVYISSAALGFYPTNINRCNERPHHIHHIHLTHNVVDGGEQQLAGVIHLLEL